MRIPEKGVIYKASPRAYVGNYLIAVGVIVLAAVVVTKFEIGFSIVPSTIGEMLNSLVYLAFAAAVAFLFEEPFLEGMIRYYVVTNSEIVKVEGILRKRRLAIPYQSVAEVSVEKGVFGRLLNYGTVDVAGFKDVGITMTHMGNPDEIQRLVQHKVNLMRPSLAQRGTRTRLEKGNKDEEPLE